MAMYTHTDSETPKFTLDEHVIYGSSRLGLRKSGLKLLGYIPTGNVVYRKRGLKRYELVNHLGNVNAVISDCRNRICEEGYISHYEADIINTYDYYPFGMLMPGRSFEAEKCSTYVSIDTLYAVNDQCNDGVIASHFTFDTATGTESGGYLNVTANVRNAGVHVQLTGMQPSTTYTIKVKVDVGTTTPNGVNISVRDYSTGSLVLVWNTNITSSGTYIYTFTTNSSANTNVTVKFQNNKFGSATFGIDYIQVYRIDEVTHTDCSPNPDSYLFGFNGKEKVDEVYGDANAYDFGARIYDPRLGRWLALDPLAVKFPSHSPYAGIGNNPIYYIDIEGKYFTGNTQRVKDIYAIVSYLSEKGVKGAAEFKAKLEAMDASEIEFNISVIPHDPNNSGGHAMFNFEQNRMDIVIEEVPQGFNNDHQSELNRLGHELEHGYQFMNGELDYYQQQDLNSNDIKSAPGPNYDKSDEFSSFATGRIFSENFGFEKAITNQEKMDNITVNTSYSDLADFPNSASQEQTEKITKATPFIVGDKLIIDYKSKYNYKQSDAQKAAQKTILK